MLGARCRVCCLGAGLWRLLALCVSCWVPQLTPGCGVEASTHRVKVEQPVAPSHWLGQGYQAGTNLPLSLWPWVQEQVSGLMLLRACVCVFMCMCVCAGELCRCESAIVYARVCAPRLPAPMTALGSSGVPALPSLPL